jgi:hypothetical protein
MKCNKTEIFNLSLTEEEVASIRALIGSMEKHEMEKFINKAKAFVPRYHRKCPGSDVAVAVIYDLYHTLGDTD